MKIYSKNDRISVDIEGVIFKLAPLSYEHKIEIQDKMIHGEETKGTILCIKYALKDVEGLESIDGKNYELQFENGVLADQCLDDVLNIQVSMKLLLTCGSLINGIPSEIINPSTGKKLEGVKIINPKQGKTKKGTSH